MFFNSIDLWISDYLLMSSLLAKMLLTASGIIFLFLFYEGRINRYKLELKKICEEQQGKLTFAAIEHEECVREKISAKLHDVGTVLSTVKLYLGMIQPIHLTDKTKVETLKDCKDLLDHTVQTARNLSTCLQPTTIKDFGLLSTLQNFCDKLNHSSGLQISISAEDNINRFQTEHELAVFRILQELTDNIIQHANAQYILFSLLHNNNNTLQIFIEHNGNGLSQEQFEQKLYMQGLGLKNVQNRINILKGKIRFKKNDNLINTISVQIPITT